MPFYPFSEGGGSPGAPANPNNTYEALGFGADGEGTVVTGGGTTHTKGSYQALGTTTNDWAGFELHINAAAAAAAQYLADIEITGVGTIVSNLFSSPGNTQGAMIYRFPLQIPSGSEIRIRHQSASTNQAMNYAIAGIIDDGNSAPGFTTCEAITAADTANTRASSVDIPISNTWTEVEDSLAQTYGAILMNLGYSGSAPAATRKLSVALGVGAAASEVEAYRMLAHHHNSGTPFFRGVSTIPKQFASGSRLAAKAQNSAGAAENIRVQLFGFR